MLRLTVSDADGYLSRTVAVARKLERITGAIPPTKPQEFVGYGLLARNRRLAEAVRRLGSRWAFEGRMFLRSMIEIYVNYAWIRLSRPHSRATRFARFETLERLQILEELEAHNPDAYSVAVAAAKRERSRVAYLFRRRSKKGELHWARYWADTPRFADRLRQVLEAQEEGSAAASFLHPLHRWNSSAVHGGPVSVASLFEISPKGPKIMGQPERDPAGALEAATVVLLVHTGVLANDLGVADKLDPEVTRLEKVVRGWGTAGTLRSR